MAMKLVFSSFILAFIVANVMGADKYSKNTNRVDQLNDIDKTSMMGREFRSRQVIQVWQKADRMNLAPNKMKELHRELLRIDGMYHKIKKESKVRENDNEIRGRDDADLAVRAPLAEIMKKYGMVGPGKFPEDKLKTHNRDAPFEDRRIAQLWYKAQKSNQFTQQELDELKEELINHEQKNKEFQNLMEEIHGDDGTKSNSVNRFENKSPDEVREMRQKEMELKLQHREIAKDFERISVKTMPEEERGPFTERRVITLWQEAKKQGFSAEDLEAIKEELIAFEGKIAEHDIAHRASLNAEIRHRSDGRNRKDQIKTADHKNLYDRAKQMGLDIHNSMKELRQRIAQGGKWNEEL